MELREGVTDRQQFRVAGVDAADERVDRIVQEFAPQPAADKLDCAQDGQDQQQAKHRVLPMFKRGKRLFLGVSDPT